MNEQTLIDKVDRKIIELIQKDPLITHTKISEKVNRSQPTVGIRIKKLEKSGILDYQAGFNLKKNNMYLARVDCQVKDPDMLLKTIDFCPFMLNVYRLSGSLNMSVMIGSHSLEHIYEITNYHFRNNPLVSDVSIEIITDVLNDMIIPLKLDFRPCKFGMKEKCVAASNSMIF